MHTLMLDLSVEEGHTNNSYHVATLALGSQPRQKGLQGCGPKGSLGVTSETPGSEGECEGVATLLWPSVGVKPNT